MLNNKQKNKLLNNWGEQADSLACKAELRVFDPLSSWQCFIIALNPEDGDTIACIISADKSLPPEYTEWSLKELAMLYNSYGEPPIVDYEYRPRNAEQIFKQLESYVT